MLEFLSSDEQTKTIATEISNLTVGQAIVLVSGIGVVKVQVPYRNAPFNFAPRTKERRLSKFREIQSEWVVKIEDVLLERKRILQQFVKEINSLADVAPEQVIDGTSSSSLLGI